MADGEINITLKSSGGNKVAAEMGKIGKASSDLIVNVKKLGNAFGELGGNIGGLLQNILKGGIWGIMQSAIAGLVSLYGKWRDAAREAAEEAKRKTEEVIAANSKLVTSIKEAADAQAAASDKALSRRDKEINKIKELTKLEIELARQREIAAAKGDSKKISAANSKAERLLADVDAEAAAQKIIARMDEAEKRIAQRKASADMAGFAFEQAEAMNQELKRRYQDAEDEAAKNAVMKAEMMLSAIQGDAYKGLSAEDKANEAAAAREEFANSKEGRELLKSIKDHADGALATAKKARDAADVAVKDAEDTLQDVSDSASLFLAGREVAAAKDANKQADKGRSRAKEDNNAELRRMRVMARLDKSEAQEADKERLDAAWKYKIAEKEAEQKALAAEQEGANEEVKLAAEEAAAAAAEAWRTYVDAEEKREKEIQKAQVEYAKAVAQERMRLDAEAHEKRMAQLKEEQEAEKRKAEKQMSIATAAQSEFDRAFAMYRDPSRAAAEIGEEKDYRADLDRLHKDARRYGGKWRIDELSALMSRGDTQGVSDTLAGWRKSKSFTPEVEAMVRASAAEQTKTTAEDELRKLNDKTASLADDIKALSEAISTEKSDLSAINSNTSNLANKVDELLSVK